MLQIDQYSIENFHSSGPVSKIRNIVMRVNQLSGAVQYVQGKRSS